MDGERSRVTTLLSTPTTQRSFLLSSSSFVSAASSSPQEPFFSFFSLQMLSGLRQVNRLARTASARSLYVWKTAPPMVKVVATIGPASEQLPMLEQVVAAGMRVMRINFSHATFDEANLRVNNLKLCRGVGTFLQ